MTNSIKEIEENDVIFVIGSNTTENHPVIATFMKRAIRKGAKLIVADPREIDLATISDVFLQVKPGSNVALINAMIKVIIDEELYDKKFIEERTEEFDKLYNLSKTFDLDELANICDVSVEDIKKASRMYASGPKSAIYYAMGITQQSDGTKHVMNIANLAMLCGHIGKEFTGVNPLRGQNNVQGACDLGGLPNVYPGYAKVVEKQNAEKFEKLWGVENLSTKLGLTVPKIMDAAYEGEVKFLYIMGENPMVSDPDLNHVKETFNRLDFLVVQDIFMTETAYLADVVLPATAFAEKNGTFTNTERRVQMVRKAINSPGEAMEDWRIFDEIMRRLGYENGFKNEEDIMKEIAKVTPQYAGITYERIEKEGGLQWPCTDKNHKGTKFLHDGKFARGKGLFTEVDYKEPAEIVDEEYPLILTTGRILYHYHTRSMTGRVEGLNQIVSEGYIEISKEYAKLNGILDGELLKVSSRRGELEVKAKVTSRITKNVVFMPFHFAETAANILTNTAIDPIANIPELKVCAVKIEKLNN